MTSLHRAEALMGWPFIKLALALRWLIDDAELHMLIGAAVTTTAMGCGWLVGAIFIDRHPDPDVAAAAGIYAAIGLLVSCTWYWVVFDEVKRIYFVVGSAHVCDRTPPAGSRTAAAPPHRWRVPHDPR